MNRARVKGSALRVAVTGVVAAAGLLAAGVASAEGFGQMQTLLSGFQMLSNGSSHAAVAAVPEPDSLALLAIAVVGLLVARKRK